MISEIRTWWKSIRRRGRHYSRNIERVSRHYSPYSAELRALFRDQAATQPFRWWGPTAPHHQVELVRRYVL